MFTSARVWLSMEGRLFIPIVYFPVIRFPVSCMLEVFWCEKVGNNPYSGLLHAFRKSENIIVEIAGFNWQQ